MAVLDQARKKEPERIRQLYKQYLPKHLDTTPVLELPVIKEPKSSADTALTAFCQLTALRLNCRRVLISLIDDNNQYILAEGTQTISLTSDSIHEDGDHLLLGSVTIPRKYGLCELCLGDLDNARKPPLPKEGKADDRKPLLPIHLFEDITLDARSKDRPALKVFTTTKFAALVPLMTRSGHNIGVIMIVNEDMIDFNKAYHKFLNDLSLVIVDHLEASRQRDNNKLTTSMVKSFGDFIDGPGSIRHDWRLLKRGARERRRKSTDFNATLEPGMKSKSGPALHGQIRPKPSISLVAEPGNDADNVDLTQITENIQTIFEEPQSMENIFARASVIIRDGMDIEGIVFVDANAATPSNAISKFKTELNDGDTTEDSLYSDDASSLPVSGGSSPTCKFESSTQNNDEQFFRGNRSESISESSSRILGFANHVGSSLNKNSPCGSLTSFNERSLHVLLARYPQGKIIHFDGTDSISGDENEESDLPSIRRPKLARKRSQEKAIDILRRIFPNVRCCIIFPLWDSHRQRWFAGGFAYTTVPTRVFTQEREFAYLHAIGNCIMAEIARHDAIMSDKAKGDFISSISHELRSPLHGILASAEFLSETELTTYQQNLTQSVVSCGKILLDCINHVLEFARTTKQDSTSLSDKSGRRESRHEMSAVNLASTLEEVVDGCRVSQAYTGSPKLQSAPLVLLNISPRASWVFQTEAGAWQRIIINIVSNAFKYTNKGFIKVQLLAQDIDDWQSNIVLTVSDSGKGIDAEFLKTKLFTPFEQEDSIAAGSGLGLSLVRTMVDDLGGHIDVQSQIGTGTTVTVNLPMIYAPYKHAIGPEHSILRTGFDVLKGKTFSFFTHHKAESAFQSPDWYNSLSEVMTSWFGMTSLVQCDKSANVVFIEQGHEGVITSIVDQTKVSPAVLIFCRDMLDAKKIRGNIPIDLRVNHLIMPCGPHKLGKALMESFPQNLKTTDKKSTINLPLSINENLNTLKHNDKVLQQVMAVTITDSQSLLQTPQEMNESTIKALLVEDNEINMKLLETFVKRKRLPYRVARNGLEATKTFRSEIGFNLIFMDISMPIMDGLQATREIRRQERQLRSQKPARIVALTALGGPDAERDALNAGVDLFLTKPISFKMVGQICDTWKRELLEL